MEIQAEKSITIIPSVSLRPTNWIREDVIFFQHGPFPAYLKRFHLSDSEFIPVEVELERHFTMPRSVFSPSCHMRKPLPNFEQKWLKRVSNNLVSRHKFRRIVKFINENKSFSASLAFSELNQQAPNYRTFYLFRKCTLQNKLQLQSA
ncbi:hypothetical protein AVEN_259845-1 [Araneus ventricosus]|uniref:Uncharacterized protein n=1 Tax=Araneus ventricosus TaxID=182803 RepID=A0A4Y2BB62_ARAVE|nr:hypothetical protein AVEN_259845-1 [Araneus ventricosus]